MDYKLVIENSHFIIVTEDAKRWLVDTGSPISFASEECCLQFGAGEYNVVASPAMIGDVNGSGLLEAPIDVLIGMDILRKHCLMFDRSNGTVTIDGDMGLYEVRNTLPLRVTNIMGQSYVCCDVSINGVSVNTILDTGACISYLSSSHLNGVESVGEVHDYNPILGEINVTKHEVTVGFDGFSKVIEVGKMPSMLELTMQMIGINFVMGLDCLDCDCFGLDLKDGKLHVLADSVHTIEEGRTL